MDAAGLRTEFEKQIKDADSKIEAAEKTLKGLQEYRLKLQGGMETLELLDPKEETPTPPETSAPLTE
tara:strand:- start:6022 stop:6222 length:201 start_codon:yes stop_codon:yes gene_type:complete